ncbi:zinc finger, CCHC-type containing protein [Tanacetum coccineum]
MEMRMKVRMLRTDKGGEFTSNEFTKYCKENGIARQLTAPYSPQQNGVVERRNRTYFQLNEEYMKANEVTLKFLGGSSQTRDIHTQQAYAKITIPHLKKLDDRSIPMIYLGVEEGSKHEPSFSWKKQAHRHSLSFHSRMHRDGHINVEHVSGELQRADILTKALPRLKFVTMRQMLGVQDLGRSNDQD